MGGHDHGHTTQDTDQLPDWASIVQKVISTEVEYLSVLLLNKVNSYSYEYAPYKVNSVGLPIDPNCKLLLPIIIFYISFMFIYYRYNFRYIIGFIQPEGGEGHSV